MGSMFVLHTLPSSVIIKLLRIHPHVECDCKTQQRIRKAPHSFIFMRVGTRKHCLWCVQCFLLTWLKGRTLALGPTSWTKLEGERLNSTSTSANTSVLRPLAILVSITLHFEKPCVTAHRPILGRYHEHFK